jgi:hypothetical protein
MVMVLVLESVLLGSIVSLSALLSVKPFIVQVLLPGFHEPPIARHEPSPFRVEIKTKAFCACGIAKSDTDMWLQLLLEPTKPARLYIIYIHRMRRFQGIPIDKSLSIYLYSLVLY